MGSNMFSSLFGGGYKTPETPKVSPLPVREDSPEDQTTRDAERKKLRARAGGVRSTLLGARLGNTNTTGNSGGLLGRSF